MYVCVFVDKTSVCNSLVVGVCRGIQYITESKNTENIFQRAHIFAEHTNSSMVVVVMSQAVSSTIVGLCTANKGLGDGGGGGGGDGSAQECTEGRKK